MLLIGANLRHVGQIQKLKKKSKQRQKLADALIIHFFHNFHFSPFPDLVGAGSRPRAGLPFREYKIINGGTNMEKIKKGDLLTLKGNETKKLYFVGIDAEFSYCGLSCVILAEEQSNKNTFSRWSQQKLREFGYCL